jgi:hypothetical protein
VLLGQRRRLLRGGYAAPDRSRPCAACGNR